MILRFFSFFLLWCEMWKRQLLPKNVFENVKYVIKIAKHRQKWIHVDTNKVAYLLYFQKKRRWRRRKRYIFDKWNKFNKNRSQPKSFFSIHMYISYTDESICVHVFVFHHSTSVRSLKWISIDINKILYISFHFLSQPNELRETYLSRVCLCRCVIENGTKYYMLLRNVCTAVHYYVSTL